LSELQMQNKTPLYDRHVALGGRVVDFHGWQLPVQYESILAEHGQCRQSAAVFDTCHMGRMLLTGPQAGADLSRVMTQDIGSMSVGRCSYGLILDEEGGIRDDAIAARLGEQEFLLVVNAATAESDKQWVLDHKSDSTELTDLLASYGKIDLQGPASLRVLSQLTEQSPADLGFFRARWTQIAGHRCILSRTGYTGELGYEIFPPAQAVEPIFDALLADERTAPAGLGARDLLRLEVGYPLYGQDIDEQTNPVEANLMTFCKMKHEFIGAEAVSRAIEQGPERKRVLLASDTRRRCHTGDEIRSADQAVGQVTSGAYSPALGVSIAMGYVRADLAEAGQELAVPAGRKSITLTVQRPPLYTEGTARTKNPETL
jgi:aminomethyltransferase